MVNQNTSLELYKPDPHVGGWWLLTDTAALSSHPGPLLPGADMPGSIPGHSLWVYLFAILFSPLIPSLGRKKK